MSGASLHSRRVMSHIVDGEIKNVYAIRNKKTGLYATSGGNAWSRTPKTWTKPAWARAWVTSWRWNKDDIELIEMEMFTVGVHPIVKAKGGI